MSERYEIEKFEQQNMMAFIELQDLENQAKAIEARKNEVRDILTRGMEENGIVSIDNDYVKISYVAPSESTSLDTKTLRAERPEIYNSLMADFSKTTKKKGYVRIKVK